MQDNPYQAPVSKVADQDALGTVEVTWGRAAKVWWSLAWRTVLFGGLAGAVLGGILGAALGAAGKAPQEIAGISTWVGLFVGIPVAIWVVRGVLRRSWSDFRIALVPVTRQ